MGLKFRSLGIRAQEIFEKKISLQHLGNFIALLFSFLQTWAHWCNYIAHPRGWKNLIGHQSIITLQSIKLKFGGGTTNYWQLSPLIGVVTTQFALDFLLFW